MTGPVVLPSPFRGIRTPKGGFPHDNVLYFTFGHQDLPGGRLAQATRPT
jgi:hypothetical protein